MANQATNHSASSMKGMIIDIQSICRCSTQPAVVQPRPDFQTYTLQDSKSMSKLSALVRKQMLINGGEHNNPEREGCAMSVKDRDPRGAVQHDMNINAGRPLDTTPLKRNSEQIRLQQGRYD